MEKLLQRFRAEDLTDKASSLVEKLRGFQLTRRQSRIVGLLLILIGVIGSIAVVVKGSRELQAGIVLSGLVGKDEFSAHRLVMERPDKPSASHNDFKWRKPEEALASTPERRLKAAKRLKIDKGEHIVLLLSVNCGNCDSEALKLNENDVTRIIGIAAAPKNAVLQWKNRLGLKFRVESVSQSVFDDLGAVILPTIVKLRDGEAVAVSEKAEALLEQTSGSAEMD